MFVKNLTAACSLLARLALVRCCSAGSWGLDLALALPRGCGFRLLAAGAARLSVSTTAILVGSATVGASVVVVGAVGVVSDNAATGVAGVVASSMLLLLLCGWSPSPSDAGPSVKNCAAAAAVAVAALPVASSSSSTTTSGDTAGVCAVSVP